MVKKKKKEAYDEERGSDFKKNQIRRGIRKRDNSKGGEKQKQQATKGQEGKEIEKTSITERNRYYKV